MQVVLVFRLGQENAFVIYLRIVIQVRINILEESAMRVLKVEIYISDQNGHYHDRSRVVDCPAMSLVLVLVLV